MVRALGTGALTVILLAVIVAVLAIPLLFVYRSTCDGRGDAELTRYSFVPPWDEPPADCRDHRRGYQVLLDEL